MVNGGNPGADAPVVGNSGADAPVVGKPNAKLENLNFLAGQLAEFARGMQAAQAAIQTGDTTAAEAASQKFDAELWRLSQRVHDQPSEKKPSLPAPAMAAVMPDAKAAPLLSSLSVMSLELRATILA